MNQHSYSHIENNDPPLYKKEAEARKGLIANIHGAQIRQLIELDLTQSKSSHEFLAKTTVKFQPKSNSGIFLDFQGKSIQKIEINTRSIDPDENDKLWDQKTGHIYLNEKDIIPNEPNTLCFTTLSTFCMFGLIKYQDNGKTFIQSSQFYYGLNKVFPCFDQPDLKAQFALKIKCPKNWNAISAENPETVKVLDPQTEEWEFFETSKPLAPHSVPIIVGEYEIIDLSNQVGIPSKFYYLKETSSYQNYTKQELTKFSMVIKQTIKYYEKFLQMPFPFTKIDFVFFNRDMIDGKIIGMGYSGAILLMKRSLKCFLYLFNQYYQVQLLMHELAHQWFGDCVTMKWWSDLWFSESFAELMAILSYENLGSENGQSNLGFIIAAKRKIDAIKADAMAEIEPIINPNVLSTRDLSTKEMTTEMLQKKGYCALLQLYYIIEKKNFRELMKALFCRFKYDNIDVDEFFELFLKIKDISKEDFSAIEDFRKNWLDSKSLNKLHVGYDESKKSLIIAQSPISSDFPLVRTHYFKIAVFYKAFDEDIKIKRLQNLFIRTKIQKNEQVTTLKLPPEIPKEFGIIFNYQEFGYFVCQIDKKLLTFFVENSSYIANCYDYCAAFSQIHESANANNMKLDDYFQLLPDVSSNNYWKISEHLREIQNGQEVDQMLQDLEADQFFPSAFESDDDELQHHVEWELEDEEEEEELILDEKINDYVSYKEKRKYRKSFDLKNIKKKINPKKAKYLRKPFKNRFDKGLNFV